MKSHKFALQIKARFITTTPLMIRSGFEGEFTDSSVEKTPEGKIHVNGYVWSSLIRRALLRIRDAQTLAHTIGKYEEEGVSPLWTEATFIDTIVTDVRPGNRIDRSYGITVKGALFNDEIAPAGLEGELRLTYFAESSESIRELKPKLLKALSVINSGIENIGAGWSYGFGRLKIQDVFSRTVDLSRDSLWDWSSDSFLSETLPELKAVEISKPWKRYIVKARILDGQLLAVHTKEPSQNEYAELPDSYVYVGHVIRDGKPEHRYIIPGRTIRQALFSVPIERALRTKGIHVCTDAGALKDGCSCQRCRWFGSAGNAGVIAVTDAVVEDAQTVVLHRIQLDEHSMQNINLFSSEYLCKGSFNFEIIVDTSREEAKGLIDEIEKLLKELSYSSHCPPGWYRLGATSTCTGQIMFTKVEEVQP